MTNDTLGARIKEARRSLDLSQSELGSLAGGMSQAWVSRVEQDRLRPDSHQLEALESVLGSLSTKPREPAAQTGEPRGPAAYKAARVATENKKRRAELAKRVERLQAKEGASIQRLADEREAATVFVRDFVQQAVGLPTEVIAELQTPSIAAFDADDDETQSLIDARNGVVQQIGIQLDAAARNAKMAGTTADVAMALGAFTAVESFALATTGTAIAKISQAISTAFGIHSGPYAARRLGIGGLAGAGVAGVSYPLGIAVAPALLGAGVALTVSGPRLLSRAQDERRQLLEASLELDRLQLVIEEFCAQCEDATRLLAHAREFATDELRRLQEGVAAGTEVEAETLVKVVALMLTLLPLPIVAGPSESAPLGTTHRANELALETAESWLVEIGALK